jgi:hypothetical protein
MRVFSSGPHPRFIALRQPRLVRRPNPAPARPVPASQAPLVGGILLGAALFFGVAVFLALPRLTMMGQEPDASSMSTPMATPSPTPTEATPPAVDVAGEDLVALPRYPGSVRSDYEVAVDEHYRLTVVEYLAEGVIDDVRAFYHGVIAAHGWERADIGFAEGEWSYSLVDGSTLALIEIEEAGGLIEIDLQISEALIVATPAPVPSATDAPLPPPPPPAPPPLPPGDDDDDDDDD